MYSIKCDCVTPCFGAAFVAEQPQSFTGDSSLAVLMLLSKVMGLESVVWWIFIVNVMITVICCLLITVYTIQTRKQENTG